MITAPVQVVGTYDTKDSTWLWGWDHPSVSESLGEFARRVRNFGEQYGKEELATRKITATMDHAWEFTALACYLNGGQGEGHFQPSAGITPASGYSGTHEVARCYIQSSSALLSPLLHSEF